jgi:hypothetical protein
VHCVNRRQAEEVPAGIAVRMAEVGLALHPGKTRIVYCKDGKRRGEHEHTSFTFLGYAFRARKARSKDGGYRTSFLPAMSPEALKAKGAQLRARRIHLRCDLTLDDLARWLTHRRRVDDVLRPVLPVRNVPPPPARQLLPEALGRKEVPATASRRAVHEVVEAADNSKADSVCPVAVGSHVLTDGRVRRAR